MDIVLTGYEENFGSNSTLGMAEESPYMSYASTLAYTFGMGAIMVLTLKNLLVPEPTDKRHRAMPPAAFNTAAKVETEAADSEDTPPVEALDKDTPEKAPPTAPSEEDYQGGDVRRMKEGLGKVSKPPSGTDAPDGRTRSDSGEKKNKDTWDAGKHWNFGDGKANTTKSNKNKWRLGERRGSEEENWRSSSPIHRRLGSIDLSPKSGGDSPKREAHSPSSGSPLRPKRLSPTGSMNSSPMGSPISSRDNTPVTSRPKSDCQGKWSFGERGREQAKWKGRRSLEDRPKSGSPSPTGLAKKTRDSGPSKSRLAGPDGRTRSGSDGRTRSDSDSWREIPKMEELEEVKPEEEVQPEKVAKPDDEWTMVSTKKGKGKSN